jgi:hypothetical protein
MSTVDPVSTLLAGVVGFSIVFLVRIFVKIVV